MKTKISFLIAVIFFVKISTHVYGSENEDIVRMYPDGSMGVDLGGGYEVAPVGKGGKEEVLMPEGYRDTYVDTPYGPMTQKGLSFYPNFRFSDTKRKEDKEKAEKETSEKAEKDYIFHMNGDSTTNAPKTSSDWGFYIPPKSQKNNIAK